ncbi:hypothetical protein [Azospirillum doebereinerae]
MRMRSRLVLLIMGVVVPLVAFAGGATLWLADEQRDATTVRMEGVVTALSLGLDHELENALALLELLSKSQALAEERYPDLRGEALTMLQGRPLWSAVVLSDPFGKFLMNTALPLGAPLPTHRDLPLFEAIRKNPEPLISDLFTGLVQRRPLLAAAFPLRSKGTLSGSLLMTLPTENLSELLRAQAMPPGWTATILDSTGTIVARSHDADTMVGRKVPAGSRPDDRNMFLGKSFDGTPVYVSSRRLKRADWTVYCLVPVGIVEGASRLTILVMLAGGTATLALALGWAALFGRRFIREVRMLGEDATALGVGQPLNAGHRFTIEEVAGVRDALHRTAQAVRQREDWQRGAEQQLRQAWNEAEAAHREADRANRAKTAFLAAASHDLRQPAQSLLLFADLLKRKMKGHASAHIVDALQQSANALNGILNGILDISKIDAGFVRTELADVPLAPIVEEIQREFAEQAAAQGLELRVVDCGVMVRTDPVLLGRVLRHLVENALKFTDKGGVLIGCRKRGSMVRLDVVDTGRGIPEEHTEAIFEEFFQVDNPGRDRKRGVGLGLAIVRRLLTALGHRMEIASRVGRGSRFSINLLVTGQRANERGAEADGFPPASRNGLLLVIEDEVYVRAAMTTVLSEWGFDVVEAASAREALATLAGRCPDLIVADYRLRDNETGYSAVGVVRTLCGVNVPAVIVSGDMSPSKVAMAREAGTSLLSKPVSLHELRKVIRKELQRL